MKKILANLAFLLIIHFYLLNPPDAFLMNHQDHQRKNAMDAKPLLPKTAGIWNRPDSPKLIDDKNIFDYMDGAGELYIAYRFDRLESYEYEAAGQKEILVELYFMESSDDAFGLLSLDWGGESMNLDVRSSEKSRSDNSTWPRALYGEGLLRIWTGDIYARVMAYQETPQSKQAVLELGRTIVNGRDNPPPPELMNTLPLALHKNWKLRKDRAAYFRSHLVLNSQYYLGHQNMLDLDHSTEAVTAPYKKQDSSTSLSRIQFLTVKYPNPEKAQGALARFHRTYLPDFPLLSNTKFSGAFANTFPIEDGWLAYKLHKNVLSLIFECPDQETAKIMINGMK